MAPRLNVERGTGFLDDCDQLGLSRAQVAHIVRAVMIRAEADPHLEAVVLASIPSTRGMLKRPRVALARVGDDITLIGIAEG